MTEAQQALLIVKGVISDFPVETQDLIHECASRIRALLRETGDHGKVALFLVGAEIQTEN